MGRLEHGRTHRHFAAQRLPLMQAIAGAARGIERQVRVPEVGKLLPSEVDIAVVLSHDLGKQLIGTPEEARHPHADKGVVAHEPGKLQVLRVGTDQPQHLPQDGRVCHAAAMQADIQLDIDPQLSAQAPGQCQVLLQMRRRIEQPLQLPRRV